MNELIPAEVNDQSIVQNEPKELTLEDLPPLTPQQAKMLDFILEGYNQTDAYRMAGYKSDQYAHTAAAVLVNRDPLRTHLSFFIQQSAKRFTPEYKLNVLNRIMQNALNPLSEYKNGELAIKAIETMAKIQGHFAQQTVQVNNVHASLDDIRNVKAEYKSDK